MTPRLTSRMLVDSLRRRVQGAGGFAAVLAHGDDTAGAILLICMEKGEVMKLLERTLDPGGNYRFTTCGPQDVASREDRDSYIRRRRAQDPDLWILELDIADAERFAAETTAID